MGEMGGIRTTPITPAQGDRPASIGALPVSQNDPSDLMVASPGVFISPSESKDFQFNKLMQEQRLKDLFNPPQPVKLQAGESLVGKDKDGEYKALYRAPAKDATPVQLDFTKTDTEIIGKNPMTGEVVSRIPISAGARYEKTDRGLFRLPNANDPNDRGEIMPGTEPIMKGQDDLKPILKEKAQNALSVIKDIKPLIGIGTVGTMGNVRRAIPMSANDAKLLQGKVNALKSQISMSELLKMKQSGASFGALSDTELALLGNSVDTLDLELQDAPTLLATISKIEELMKKSAGGPEYGIGAQSDGGGKALKLPGGKSYSVE
jgi:hypothetical protein